MKTIQKYFQMNRRIMMDKFVEANSSNYERLSIKDRIKAFQQLGKNAGHIITKRQAK